LTFFPLFSSSRRIAFSPFFSEAQVREPDFWTSLNGRGFPFFFFSLPFSLRAMPLQDAFRHSAKAFPSSLSLERRAGFYLFFSLVSTESRRLPGPPRYDRRGAFIIIDGQGPPFFPFSFSIKTTSRKSVQGIPPFFPLPPERKRRFFFFFGPSAKISLFFSLFFCMSVAHGAVFFFPSKRVGQRPSLFLPPVRAAVLPETAFFFLKPGFC